MRNINWERRDKIGKVQANIKLKKKKKNEMGSWKNSKKSKMLIKKGRDGIKKRKKRKKKRKVWTLMWLNYSIVIINITL